MPIKGMIVERLSLAPEAHQLSTDLHGTTDPNALDRWCTQYGWCAACADAHDLSPSTCGTTHASCHD
jgi:hypothetical protein